MLTFLKWPILCRIKNNAPAYCPGRCHQIDAAVMVPLGNADQFAQNGALPFRKIDA
jgi:hypothetical protein